MAAVASSSEKLGFALASDPAFVDAAAAAEVERSAAAMSVTDWPPYL